MRGATQTPLGRIRSSRQLHVGTCQEVLQPTPLSQTSPPRQLKEKSTRPDELAISFVSPTNFLFAFDNNRLHPFDRFILQYLFLRALRLAALLSVLLVDTHQPIIPLFSGIPSLAFDFPPGPIDRACEHSPPLPAHR